jgi:NAD(P)-dependent dehydrogenase (short-subunit alcohol dehydrogenase family)
MTRRLEDKTALVTGATSGIGRAIASAFAAGGAHVAIIGRDADRGHATVAEIRDSGGRADFIRADIAASTGAVRQLANDATEILGGRVDILVNNAGIFPSTPTATLDDATFDAVIATNIRAPIFLTQALVPAMIARGSGVIINIGSWISTVGLQSGPLYSASKAMLEQATRAWSAEFGQQGIRVNTLAPGVILTEGSLPVKDHQELMARGFPAGRVGSPDDIAKAAVFLASDDASYMHAATLLVDGGALSTRLQ